MSNATALSQPSSNSTLENRLGVAHFLLWISATAAIMAAFRPSLIAPVFDQRATATTRQFMQRQHRAALITIPTIAPIWGLGLASVGLAVWRLIRKGQPFPVQPGHWLLLIVGSGVLAIMPLPGVVHLDGPWRGLRNLLLVLIWSAAGLLPPAVLCFAAFRIRGPLQWRVAFWALSGGMAVLIFGIFWSMIEFEVFHHDSTGAAVIALGGLVWSLISICGFMVVPLIDVYSRCKYDALHWLGAAILPMHLAWLVVWLVIGSWVT